MTAELPLGISVQDVAQLMHDNHEFLLLDCRQAEEYELVHLPNAQLIPMDQLPQRVGELPDKLSRIVVYCHLGGRSELVAQWLRDQGFANAQTMDGGVDAWSQWIDPSLPRY